MPVSSEREACVEMLALVKTAWDAGGATAGKLLGYEGSPLDRPAAAQSGKAGSADVWGWTTIRHVGTRQATMGPSGQKRYRATGVLTTETYTPLTNGLQTAYEVGRIVAEGLRGARTDGGATMHRVRLVEVGRDGPWFHLNVLAEFEYDII